MLTKIQLRWLEALESGKYNQGIGNLKSNDRYCCLGVACELLGLSQKIEDGMIYFGYDHSYHSAIMPYTSWKLLGLKDGSGYFEELNIDGNIIKNRTLAFLNDSGWTFKQIANVIRKNPEVFFVDDNVLSPTGV